MNGMVLDMIDGPTRGVSDPESTTSQPFPVEGKPAMRDQSTIAPPPLKTIDRFPGYGFGADGTAWSRRSRRDGAPWRPIYLIRHERGKRHRVNLWCGGKVSNHDLAELVLEAHVGPRPEGHIVAFRDGDSGNPRLDNIEWKPFDDVRFWPFVAKGEGCWAWIGYTNGPAGYGMLCVGGRLVLAHRYSYELHNGPIGDGLFVCHSCDNPICCRPDHLFLGTCAENVRDMVSKGRGRKSSLSSEQMQAIRERYARGGVSMAALGREVGLSAQSICDIVNGRRG